MGITLAFVSEVKCSTRTHRSRHCTHTHPPCPCAFAYFAGFVPNVPNPRGCLVHGSRSTTRYTVCTCKPGLKLQTRRLCLRVHVQCAYIYTRTHPNVCGHLDDDAPGRKGGALKNHFGSLCTPTRRRTTCALRRALRGRVTTDTHANHKTIWCQHAAESEGHEETRTSI